MNYLLFHDELVKTEQSSRSDQSLYNKVTRGPRKTQQARTWSHSESRVPAYQQWMCGGWSHPWKAPEECRSHQGRLPGKAGLQGRLEAGRDVDGEQEGSRGREENQAKAYVGSTLKRSLTWPE